MSGVLVVTCKLADYDASTGECAAPFYSAPSSGWPALTLADAQLLGTAVALLWASAWCIRRLAKMLDQLN